MTSKASGKIFSNYTKIKNRVIRYIKKAYRIIMKPEMGILPGQLAFFMLLSLVPIITLCGYAGNLFGINIDTLVEFIQKYVPSGADYLIPYLVGDTIDFKLALMFIWMFYLASNSFNSVILASNQIYGLTNSNWFRRRIKAVLMLISMVLVLIVILLFPVFGDKFVELFSYYNWAGFLITIFNIVKTPIIWFIIFMYIKIIYIVAPDRMRKNSNVNIGALFTTFGWIIITYVYRFLALNIAQYNFFYGALSTIALLMLWIYFISFVFVIGLILNYGKEENKDVIDKEGALKVIKGY